jgi:glycosyltransferase involved in cell wall biosynthesis
MLEYTVVIPAYNAADTIADAIHSILDQTVLPAAIVVVDDGSTDQTGALAAGTSPLVHVIRQENAGVSQATNRGIDAVETPLVAFLDADDIWLSDKCARQIERLEADEHIDAVFARMRFFRDGQPNDAPAEERDTWGRPTLLIRTERLRFVGPLFDPSGGGGRGDMVDWIARARDAGLRMEMMPEVLALRRIHARSMSYGYGARDVGYLHAVKAALDRRRAAGGK